jgi:predicted Zn-dependent peptidase
MRSPLRSLHRFVLGLGAALALACHPTQHDGPAPGGDAPPLPVEPSVAEILLASELPPEQREALADDPMGVTVHRLKNGMTVYISTNRQEPELATWIAVRTGSRNDPADSTGLAHYLEHMLFKGTDELGTTDIEAERPHLERIAGLYDRLRKTDDTDARAEIFAAIDRETQATAAWAIPEEGSRIYGALGIGGFNAFTDDDSTVYVADVPSNRLEAWAAVEVERFRDAEFRLFYPELESVYEEKNISLDEPWDRIDEAARLGLFPVHPYGTQPTLGLVEHLKSPAYGDMVAYFERWYAPNNMAILLVGDVDPATALPVLEHTLGTLVPKRLTEPAKGELRPIEGRVFREVIAEGEESVTIAWRTVSDVDPDEPTMVVLDALMGNETNGLLALELELTQKVPGVYSWASHMREAGYWVAGATAREGQSLEEVEKLLLGVVAKVKAGQIEQATIDAVVLHQDMHDKQRLESNDGRISKLHNAYISRRSWSQMLERDAWLRKVTNADVVKAANQYLGDDRVVVYRKRGKPELPKIDKPRITPIEMDAARESAFSRKIAAIPAKELEPEWVVEGKHYERRTLSSGPLLTVHNARNDLFQLMMVVERGHRKDRLLCHAFRLLELSGSGSKSAEALRDELYSLGTNVEFQCGADETTIKVTGLDRHMDASMTLLREWLDGAVFDAETLAALNDNTLSERRDVLDDPSALDYLLRQHAFYGEASDFKAQPRNRELLAAKPAALAKLIRGFLDYERATYYFGSRSADAAAEALVLGRGTKDPGSYPRIEYRAVAKPTIYLLHKDVAKATINLAIPQGPLPRERVPEALTLGQYMDGSMTSLLYLELREARGLAYGCDGYQSMGGRPGDDWAFIGTMGTQVDKTVEALQTYLEVIERPIAEAHLVDVKQAMDQNYRSSRFDPRWVFYWIRAWDLRGETGDPRPWEWKASGALDVAGLQPLAATLGSRPALVGILSDRKRIDLAALAKLGEVVEVEVGELTSFGAFPNAKRGAEP